MAKENFERLEQLFADHLEKVKEEIYKSCYVFSDFQREISYPAEFKRHILEEKYGHDVWKLLNMQADEFEKTIANYKWQIKKKKRIAGKSLMILLLAEKEADGERKQTLTKILTDIKEIVFENMYAPYIDEADYELSSDELLNKGNEARKDGEPRGAVAYYKLAMQKGNVEAMAYLGLAFFYGVGVEKDGDKALWLFEEAAKKVLPEGLYGLALCYLTGTGVASDVEKARALLQASDSLRYGEAGMVLEICEEKDAPESLQSMYDVLKSKYYDRDEDPENPKDEGLSEFYEWEAAKYGASKAKYAVEMSYTDGQMGYPTDTKKERSVDTKIAKLKEDLRRWDQRIDYAESEEEESIAIDKKEEIDYKISYLESTKGKTVSADDAQEEKDEDSLAEIRKTYAPMMIKSLTQLIKEYSVKGKNSKVKSLKKKRDKWARYMDW